MEMRSMGLSWFYASTFHRLDLRLDQGGAGKATKPGSTLAHVNVGGVVKLWQCGAGAEPAYSKELPFVRLLLMLPAAFGSWLWCELLHGYWY
jgi:hypothetical protein